MFKGLSAFPLTPLENGKVDEKAFISLVERLAHAGVDSIGALGSTGSYAYLTLEQRKHITKLAISAAAGIPVMTSIGSVRFDDVLQCAEDAQKAGVSGVLMAPVSYQRLTEEEVYDLYSRVTRELSVPLCVYDNPATTGFHFTDELLIAIADLPNVGSVKLGSLPSGHDEASVHLENLRSRFPAGVTIGISGDGQSAAGLLAGCEVWYSVIAGLYPEFFLKLARAARAGDVELTHQMNDPLRPLWAFFQRHGSLRVVATIAELNRIVQLPALPLPLKTLQGSERDALQKLMDSLDFL
jgi:4-hydroxy-tetrahydrodipicolinate synthase